MAEITLELVVQTVTQNGEGRVKVALGATEAVAMNGQTAYVNHLLNMDLDSKEAMKNGFWPEERFTITVTKRAKPVSEKTTAPPAAARPARKRVAK